MRTRWNDFNQMFEAMDMLRNRMNHAFGTYDPRYSRVINWNGPETMPRTNLSDTGDNLEVLAELPGVDKENIQVKIQGNYLEISGSRKTDIPEGYKVHRVERESRAFSRSFTLPYEVNAEKVEATLQDGVLKLILPKAETAKPRQISVH